MKDEEENFPPKGPSEGLILGARRQILKIARSLEEKGKFEFELLDCPRFSEYDSDEEPESAA